MTEPERRTVRVSAMITPATRDRLDAYADRHRWARSTAVQVMVEKCLDEADKEEDQ